MITMEEDDRGQVCGAGAKNLPERLAVDEDDDGGFSFPVPPQDTSAFIVPVYPVFGRPSSPRALPGDEGRATATLRVPLGRLLLEEREFRARERDGDGRSVSARQLTREVDGEDDDDEASAGADEELEGVPPESYCLWAPGGGVHQASASVPASPPRCRKSGSTGSVLRWRRISDRLVGRSHSDGKEKFVFLSAPAASLPPPPPGPLAGGKSKDEQREGGGGKGDAALRYYGRGGSTGGSGRRRSYLPYKQELVGLFANVSGLRRSYHPF